VPTRIDLNTQDAPITENKNFYFEITNRLPVQVFTDENNKMYKKNKKASSFLSAFMQSIIKLPECFAFRQVTAGAPRHHSDVSSSFCFFFFFFFLALSTTWRTEDTLRTCPQ